MPITTHRNPTKDLTTFKCNGDLSFTEIVAVIERYFQAAIAPPTSKILWDLRTASIDTLTKDHVYRIANLVNDYKAKAKGTKISVVVSKEINFEMVKRFKTESKKTLKNIIVFRKIDEATEWIEKESE